MSTEVNKKASEAAKAWRLANIDRYREYQREYRRRKRAEKAAYKELGNTQTVASRISSARFQELYNYQGGKCRLCAKSMSVGKLSVRLNPTTDRVKALVCPKCVIIIEAVAKFINVPNFRQRILEYDAVPDFEFQTETGLPNESNIR